MDLAPVLEAVAALREARGGWGFVLSAPAVVDQLMHAIPAVEISFNDLDLRARQSRTSELLPVARDASVTDPFWEHFWDTRTCTYTEQYGRLRREVMTTGDFYSDRQWRSTGMYTEMYRPAGLAMALCVPLPGPPGTARKLVFFREPGHPFRESERDTAVLLQPHVIDALRYQGRHEAARLVTARQAELLRLVAAGHDNIAIARLLRISPATVGKHLENAYLRLEVTSRTAAVAKVCPDVTWR